MMRADYLSIDGAAAFVEQWGDGRPLLCIHTAGQSGVQWRSVAPGLVARGYHVIVPDLPGHGRSEPAREGPVRDLGRYGAWCEKLIDHLRFDAPLVIGCSIGGKIALDLAIRCGKRLSGVVAMAADSGMAKNEGAAMVRRLERELEDSAAPSRSDRTYLGTLAVVGRGVAKERAELMGWASFDCRGSLADIACPVHLVVGEDDLWLDPANVRRTAENIPTACYTLVEGIGHYPMEELDDAAERIHAWIAQMMTARRV
ncbi:MAG: alpha/beta hydrolase [Casimicrobiaceae bacterium]